MDIISTIYIFLVLFGSNRPGITFKLRPVISKIEDDVALDNPKRASFVAT